MEMWMFKQQRKPLCHHSCTIHRQRHESSWLAMKPEAAAAPFVGRAEGLPKHPAKVSQLS